MGVLLLLPQKLAHLVITKKVVKIIISKVILSLKPEVTQLPPEVVKPEVTQLPEVRPEVTLLLLFLKRKNQLLPEVTQLLLLPVPTMTKLIRLPVQRIIPEVRKNLVRNPLVRMKINEKIEKRNNTKQNMRFI